MLCTGCFFVYTGIERPEENGLEIIRLEKVRLESKWAETARFRENQKYGHDDREGANGES